MYTQLANLSDGDITQVLEPFGVDVPCRLADDIRVYISTLLFWNSKIALTAVTDPIEILRIHFAESFFAARIIGVDSGRVADIGTGPGFPGIPMRMVLPNISLTLIESNGKKTAFLHEVVRKLSLANVEIMRSRMEDVRNSKSNFSLITARALGKYDDLLLWSRPRLVTGGNLALFVSGDEAEVISARDFWTWQERIQIPQSNNRYILIGTAK